MCAGVPPHNLPDFGCDISDLKLEAVAQLEAPVSRHRLRRLACGCHRNRPSQMGSSSLVLACGSGAREGEGERGREGERERS